MTTQIRCPRCKAETDSSTAKPGSVIKCVHCRGDMRVPDVAKSGGPGIKGGRQSTLFRKMTNATVPGQRGRAPSVPTGGGRPGADAPRDMSGVYKGIGIAGGIAAVIVIGILMKGKSPEPEKTTGKKSTPKTVAPLPPPPPPPPPVDTKAEIEKSGAPPTYEHGADSLVHYSIKPLTPSDPAAEKDAMTFIKNVNMPRILATPYRYLPFVINSMISEDQAMAVASFQVLHGFCEEMKLYTSDGKNVIDLHLVNSPKYRAWMYQEWVTKFWPERSNKLPDSPGNKEAVERENWVELARRLQGGAYHTDDNQGIAYRKVKSYGKAAWPKLVALIDHEELPVARSAGQLLNDLTGEKKPLPNEQNRTELRNAWTTWVEKNK